jgi:hypothetical protein
MALKLLSSEINLAKSVLIIGEVLIKERCAEIFRKCRPPPIL